MNCRASNFALLTEKYFNQSLELREKDLAIVDIQMHGIASLIGVTIKISNS